jgi:hypothetical protein
LFLGGGLTLDHSNSTCLLRDVGQFMRQQLSPGGGCRRPLARAEHHVITDGVRARRDTRGTPRGTVVGMHPHRAEITAEARLEVAATRRIKWRTCSEPAGKAGSNRATSRPAIRLPLYQPLITRG